MPFSKQLFIEPVVDRRFVNLGVHIYYQSILRIALSYEPLVSGTCNLTLTGLILSTSEQYIDRITALSVCAKSCTIITRIQIAQQVYQRSANT